MDLFLTMGLLSTALIFVMGPAYLLADRIVVVVEQRGWLAKLPRLSSPVQAGGLVCLASFVVFVIILMFTSGSLLISMSLIRFIDFPMTLPLPVFALVGISLSFVVWLSGRRMYQGPNAKRPLVALVASSFYIALALGAWYRGQHIVPTDINPEAGMLEFIFTVVATVAAVVGFIVTALPSRSPNLIKE